MTKLNEEQRAEIRCLLKHRNSSVAAVARKYSIAWETAKKCLLKIDKVTHRKTSAFIKRRRALVERLAKTTVLHDGKRHPKYTSASSLCQALSGRFKVSNSTVLRDLKSLGFKCFVCQMTNSA